MASLAVPEGPLAGVLYAALVAAALRFGPGLGSASLRAAGSRAIALFRIPRIPRLLRPTFGRRARWASGALVAIALVVVSATQLWPSASSVRVRALDVGQGDAFLIEVSGRTMLVDGGPDPARLLAELGASLPPWTRRIDV